MGRSRQLGQSCTLVAHIGWTQVLVAHIGWPPNNTWSIRRASLVKDGILEKNIHYHFELKICTERGVSLSYLFILQNYFPIVTKWQEGSCSSERCLTRVWSAHRWRLSYKRISWKFGYRWQHFHPKLKTQNQTSLSIFVLYILEYICLGFSLLYIWICNVVENSGHFHPWMVNFQPLNLKEGFRLYSVRPISNPG